LIFVFLSGIAGALFGLSYKIRAQLNLEYRRVLLVGGAWSIIMSAAAVIAYGEPFYSLPALLIGIPWGISLTLSMIVYFRVVERAKLNVSWTFIQLSLIIPFALSVLVYGEGISWLNALGIGLVFATIFLFGLGKVPKEGRDGQWRKAAGDLILTLVLTGISQSFPKVYQALPGDRPTLTVLLYASVGMLLSAIVTIFMPARSDGATVQDKQPALAIVVFAFWMSAARLAVPLLILLALGSVAGTIVFPLRTITNIIAVLLLSFAFYGERLKASEAMGIPVAVAAIVLLTL